MDEQELRAALHTQITSAAGYIGGEISEDRRAAMDAYNGEPLGNEIDGRSQIVSSDTFDTIEGMLPDLMQIFTSSDRAVEFAARSEEDEEMADQATDYVNFIWNNDNDGFLVFYDLFKDALIQINGVAKIWWDENPGETRSTHTGLDASQVAYLLDQDGVEAIEHEEYWPEKTLEFFEAEGIDPEQDEEILAALFPPEMELAGKLHDLTLKRKQSPRTRVMGVPPEHFLISRRATSLDDAPFMAHWEQKTVSELIEDGFDPGQLEDIPSEDTLEFNEERTARFNREDEYPFEQRSIDGATRIIEVFDCYVRADFDGDGIAELLNVKVAGPQHEILKYKDGKELAIEPVEDHPFVSVTPIRIPHKFFGRSFAEIVEDIFKSKTSIFRQALDNMYNANNARAAISSKVNLGDYLNNKVGSPIRVDTQGADVGGHIVPVPTQMITGDCVGMLEYWDRVRESRSGVNLLSQGLDPDALNSTASGINQLLGRSQMRMLMVAQLFAYGVRDAFRKILKLVIAHQDKPRVIRLRNKWVEMDPRVWDAEMDVQVNVGLGRGTQEQKVMTAQMVVQMTLQLLQIQGGIAGPFVYPHQVREAFAKLYEVLGLKSADPFIADIGEEETQQIMQQMQGQSDPEVELKKQELALKQEEAQAKLKLEFTKEQMAHIQKLAEMGMQQQADHAQLQLEAFLGQQKLALEEYKIDKQAQTATARSASNGKG